MGAELRDHRRPPPGLARVQADVQRTVDAGEVRLSESSPSATRFRRAGRGRVEVITFKLLSKNPGALQSASNLPDEISVGAGRDGEMTRMPEAVGLTWSRGRGRREPRGRREAHAATRRTADVAPRAFDLVGVRRRQHIRQTDRVRKKQFVLRAARSAHRACVWDLGCNTGEYSRAVSACADRVIASMPTIWPSNACIVR